MPSSGMLCRVALVRTDVSEESSAPIIRVTRIGELGTVRSSQRASVANYGYHCSWFTDSCHPDDGGAKFLRNIGSYKSHRA
jgi:hypothetical protein